MKTVLLTTSGTGSRLGPITSSTNKSLVPIGDKYAICHIIDWYDDDTEFVVTIGYHGKLVKDFLDMAYPHKTIHYVPVDRYEGPGSSLGYSMLQAKSLLMKPFYFHCCDTILTDPMLSKTYTNNTLFVSTNDDIRSYSSVVVKDDRVITVNAKNASQYDYVYIGLSYIQDYHSFWTHLEQLYEYSDMTLSDIHVYQCMLSDHTPFSYHVVNAYHDTGNLVSYTKTRSHFKSSFSVLEKDTENLCFLGNKVIKFCTDVNLHKKRCTRGELLSPLTPTILATTDHFLCMEFIHGQLVSESKTYGEIRALVEWAKTNLWTHPVTHERFRMCCFRFYKTKTEDRLRNIPFMKEERSVINGVTVQPIIQLLNEIDFQIICTDTLTRFHGDFILDNIIKRGENDYVLLDWRHEFDTELEVGDMYYDLAKLCHNIVLNHANIKKELFTISYQGEHVEVDIKCNYMLMKQLECVHEFVQRHQLDGLRIELLTALIWLNMAPLYVGVLREFLFYFGKFHLHLAVQKQKKLPRKKYNDPIPDSW